MSVLLTDEAVVGTMLGSHREATRRQVIEAFLRYHATEGREALVELVGAVLWGDYHCCKVGLHNTMPVGEASLLFANEDRETRLIYRAKAEAVVTVLFGGGASDA